MYLKKILLLLCAVPCIVFANDQLVDTQFLDLKIKDFDTFINDMSQKIEGALKLKDLSQMSFLMHAYNEAIANKESAKALREVLKGKIKIHKTVVISQLKSQARFISDADALLNSLVDNGGKLPAGNRVLNSSIREVLGDIPKNKNVTSTEARRIRQHLHGLLAIKERTYEALQHFLTNKLTEGSAMKYIDGRISSLAHQPVDNPFYKDMEKFIVVKKVQPSNPLLSPSSNAPPASPATAQDIRDALVAIEKDIINAKNDAMKKKLTHDKIELLHKLRDKVNADKVNADAELLKKKLGTTAQQQPLVDGPSAAKPPAQAPGASKPPPPPPPSPPKKPLPRPR